MKKKFPPGSNQRNGGRGRGRCGGVDGRRGGCGGGGGSGTAGDRLERRSEHGLDDGRGQCLGVVAARRPHQRRRRQRRRRVHVEAVEEGAERGRFARRRRAARLRNQSVPTFSAQLVRLGNKSFVKKKLQQMCCLPKMRAQPREPESPAAAAAGRLPWSRWAWPMSGPRSSSTLHRRRRQRLPPRRPILCSCSAK